MEPTDAVIAAITRPAVPPSTVRADPGGWVAKTFTGGYGHTARPETIRVLRQKVLGRRALVAVEFTTSDNQPMFWVGGAVMGDDGAWTSSGGAGGGGREPIREIPWANLGGWGNQRFLCAGGRVYGENVAKVRLVDPGGRVVDDDVQGGIALLIGDLSFQDPHTLELVDKSGQLLAEQQWPLAH